MTQNQVMPKKDMAKNASYSLGVLYAYGKKDILCKCVSAFELQTQYIFS